MRSYGERSLFACFGLFGKREIGSCSRNRVVFDDEVFSKSRLKSCFLFSFSSWASLVIDVEHPFVGDLFSIP